MVNWASTPFIHLFNLFIYYLFILHSESALLSAAVILVLLTEMLNQHIV